MQISEGPTPFIIHHDAFPLHVPAWCLLWSLTGRWPVRHQLASIQPRGEEIT